MVKVFADLFRPTATPDPLLLNTSVDLIRSVIQNMKTDRDYARVEAMIESMINKHYQQYKEQVLNAADQLFKEMNRRWAEVSSAYYTTRQYQ